MRLIMNLHSALTLGVSLSFLSVSPAVHALNEPAAGSLSPSTLKSPSGPASIKGLAQDPSLSLFSAQIQYQIPIDLPAGPGGIKPSMSLMYDGSLGSGAMGMGWKIDVPRIERKTQKGVPTFTSADELILNGVAFAGDMIADDDGTYWVAGQGLKAKGAQAGNGYVFTDSSGTQYLFGITANGRQASGADTFGWWLEKLENIHGQEIFFYYTQHEGQIYPDKIQYGPADAFVIEFQYETRDDVVLDYKKGFSVRTEKRLQNIVVNAFDEVLKTYHLTYEEKRGLSRLSQVRMTGRGGEGEMPALSFGYEEADNFEMVEVTEQAPWLLHDPNATWLDVNQDGLADMLDLAAGNYRYALNTGNGFSQARNFTGYNSTNLSAQQIRFMDLSGNSRAELVVSSGSGWNVYNLVGEDFTSAGSWSNTWDVPLHDASWRFADMNGDGRTDAVKQLSDGLSIRWGEDNGMSDPFAVTFSSDLMGLSITDPNTHLQDFNGDGLADIVKTSDDDVMVYHGLGDGNFSEVASFNVNLAGFVGNQIRLADLNRDGITDLVLIDGSYVEWVPIYPTYRVGDVVPLESPDDGSEATVMITDFNGNGSQDVVWSSYNDLYYLDLAGPTHFGMLTTVQNGFGKTTTYAYSSSAALAQAALEADEPWSFALPSAMPVPIQQTHTFASGEPDQVSLFSVRDGFWDGEERRFGGFLLSETTSQGATPVNTLVEEVIYHPGIGEERCLRGKVVQKTRKDGNGKVFDVEQNTYDAFGLSLINSDHPKLKMPLPLSNTKNIYEGSTTPVSIKTEYSYNEYGQKSQEHHHGRLDMDQDQKIIHTQYANNFTEWVLDKKAETYTSEDSTSAHYQKTRYFYYSDDGNILDNGESGNGLLAEIKQYNQEEDRWLDVAEKQYDTAGNEIWNKAKGVVSDIIYDNDKLFAIEEKLNRGDGTFWSWTAQWDKTLGKITSVTSPDGVIESSHYDSLGRLTGQSRNNGEPFITYAYDWDNPFSTITETENANTDSPFVKTNIMNSNLQPVFSRVTMANSQRLIGALSFYDERGELVKKHQNFFTTEDTPGESDYENISALLLEKDALGRDIRSTGLNGVVQNITHHASRTHTAVAGIGDSIIELDGLGRRTAFTRQGEDQTIETRYYYNVLDLPASITKNNDAWQKSFSYNSMGQLIQSQSPEVGVSYYTYDDMGRLKTRTNAESQERSYVFDELGRLIEKKDNEGISYKYHYDEQHPDFGDWQENVEGRLSWIEEPNGFRAYSYDQYGRPDKAHQNILGISVAMQKEMLPSGTLSAFHLDDLTISYQYNNAGQLTEIENVWEAEEITADGIITRERFANGVLQTKELDENMRAVAVKTFNDDTVFQHQEMTYNNHGALSAVDDLIESDFSRTVQYTYNKLNQIVSAEYDDFEVDYAFDALGNLTSKTVTGQNAPLQNQTLQYGLNGQSVHQLSQFNDTGFNYDLAGRIIGAGTAAYTYDTFDRLKSIDNENEQATYTYGHDDALQVSRSNGTIQSLRFENGIFWEDQNTFLYVQNNGRMLARLPISPISNDLVGAGSNSGAGFIFPLQNYFFLTAVILLLVLMLQSKSRRRLVLATLVFLSCDPNSDDTPQEQKTNQQNTDQDLFDTDPPASPPRDAGPNNTTANDGGTPLEFTDDGGTSLELFDDGGVPHLQELNALYFHNTGLTGGIALVTSEAGQLLEGRLYSPYGSLLEGTQDMDTHGAVGKHQDKLSGFQYYGGRWYAPQWSQWLTADPLLYWPGEDLINQGSTLHPYAFNAGNPVNKIDPDGARTEEYMGLDFSQDGRTILGTTKSSYFGGKVFKYSSAILFGALTAGMGTVASVGAGLALEGGKAAITGELQYVKDFLIGEAKAEALGRMNGHKGIASAVLLGVEVAKDAMEMPGKLESIFVQQMALKVMAERGVGYHSRHNGGLRISSQFGDAKGWNERTLKTALKGEYNIAYFYVLGKAKKMGYDLSTATGRSDFKGSFEQAKKHGHWAGLEREY